MAMSLMLRTMSVTSSRTPGIEENSCSTPSICTEVIAAPCSDDKRMRRSALPSVSPKPRSSGSATKMAIPPGGLGDDSRHPPRVIAGADCELLRLYQFLPVLLNHGSHLSKSPADPRGTCGRRHTLQKPLDAAALARPATIVRDRRHVADRRYREARRLQ